MLRGSSLLFSFVVSSLVSLVFPACESDPDQEPTTPPIVRGAAGCTKVCQFIGDKDLQTGASVKNQTLTRAGIYGTDLGASFEHDGKLWFLFGDTVGASMNDEDAIAWSADTTPEDCLDLTFPVDANKKWVPLLVPGLSQGAFEVPMEGVSAQGKMYVYLTTDHSNQHDMGRSVLARSADQGGSFQLVTDISRLGKFINISAEKVSCADSPELPGCTGEGLLLWGSGEYRRSSVALAFQPLSAIEDPSAIRYFAGLEQGVPRWSAAEGDAVTLFDQPCVGELSVVYSSDLKKWLMTYNCLSQRGILLRTADKPWGPWSSPVMLFDPDKDNGYCHFMHVSYQDRHCDTVYDPNRENEYGGEYGPYLIPRFFQPGNGSLTIYFTMSTWNPYTVVLMKAELVRAE